MHDTLVCFGSRVGVQHGGASMLSILGSGKLSKLAASSSFRNLNDQTHQTLHRQETPRKIERVLTNSVPCSSNLNQNSDLTAFSLVSCFSCRLDLGNLQRSKLPVCPLPLLRRLFCSLHFITPNPPSNQPTKRSSRSRSTSSPASAQTLTNTVHPAVLARHPTVKWPPQPALPPRSHSLWGDKTRPCFSLRS